MKKKCLVNLFLVLLTLLPSYVLAYNTNMGTKVIKVGEEERFEVAGSNQTASGSWKITGDCARIAARANKSCKVLGLKAGTATLTWNGFVDATSCELYWTINVVSSGTSDKTNKISLSFEPSGGSVSKGDFIKFVTSPDENWVDIYYTTDGSDPKSSNTKILSSSMKGFTITQSCTVKAYATASLYTDKYTDSDVVSESFTIKESSQKKRTINLEQAGKLNQLLSEEEKLTITDLTLSGKLNGSDLRVLRYMAGKSHEKDNKGAPLPTDGHLSVLDLREATFVEGGNYYIYQYGVQHYTKNSDDLPDLAFAWCTKLTKLYLPNKSTTLNWWALHMLENLEDVELPKGLKEIKANFRVCTNLKSLTIPAGVTSVNEDCFYKAGLSTIYCYAMTPPKVGGEFSSDVNNITLYVPKGTYDAYQKAQGWRNISNIIDNLSGDVLVSKISLSSDKINMEVGDSSQIEAIIEPNDATDKEVSWSSSDNQIVIVDNDGYVYALAEGSATITCTAKDGSGVKATCKVTVKAPSIKVSKIILNKSSTSLIIGQQEQLTATIEPEDAVQKEVEWASSKEEVATVNENGLVTAVAEGTAIISCTAIDGSGVSDICVVQVEKNAEYESIGTGTIIDNFFDGEARVEILQNQAKNNIFKIINPYDGIANPMINDSYKGGEEMEIYIMAPGQSLRNEKITMDDLIYFTSTNTGFFHSEYNSYIEIYHPSEFKKYGLENDWTYNRVLGYQNNGWPDKIQLAPYYYMKDIGGWDCTQQDNVVIITFPRDPTDIKGVKIVENKEKRIYDILGRKLKQPNKGINIINGQKVFVK